VLEGQESSMDRFLTDLQSGRKADTDSFYQRYGVIRETAYLQETALGKILIVVTDIDEADKNFASYGASKAEFEAWFKDRVKEFSGIDLNASPRGPEAKRLLDWSRKGEPLT